MENPWHFVVLCSFQLIHFFKKIWLYWISNIFLTNQVTAAATNWKDKQIYFIFFAKSKRYLINYITTSNRFPFFCCWYPALKLKWIYHVNWYRNYMVFGVAQQPHNIQHSTLPECWSVYHCMLSKSTNHIESRIRDSFRSIKY